MKKLFYSLSVAVFAVAMMASGVWASSIGRGAAVSPMPAYASGLTIAGESFAQNYDLDMDSAINSPNVNAVGGAVRFEASWGMNSGDEITFTFTNALWMSNGCVLMAEEAAGQQPSAGACDFNNDGDSLDVVEIASNFGALDPTNGVTSITVRINNGLVLPTGTQMVLCFDNSGAENDDVVTPGVLDDEASFGMLRMPAGTPAPANIGVSVSGQTQGGSAIGAATCSNTIMNTLNQCSLAVQTAGTSIIDVDAAAGSRYSFDEEGGADDILTTAADTDLGASGALLRWISTAGTNGIEDPIDISAAGDVSQLTLTLTPSTGAFNSQENFAANDVYLDWLDTGGANGGADDANDKVFVNNVTDATVTFGGDTIDADSDDDLYIGVTQTGTLGTKTFNIQGDLNFTNAQYTDQTYGPFLSHTWTINGLQAQIPYMVLNASGYLSFIKVSNDSALAGDFIVDAIIWNVTDDITTQQQNVVVKNIPGNSSTTVSEADLMTALALDASKIYHVSMLVTVVAPVNQVHVAAFQKDSVGRTEVPVLYDNNVRTWMK